MKNIPGGICAPKGFRASGVAAHIKNAASTKKDCALILSDTVATLAGVFTKNLLKAPPLHWTEGVCGRGKGRCVFINSGNANACTGARGIEDAQRTAEVIALEVGIPASEVCVLSTGVIGVPLPMDRIEAGAKASVRALSLSGGGDAAVAIMTTDTVPKELAVEVPLSTGSIRIGAMAKGSGMIAPDMATMICILTTDAAIAESVLRPLLTRAVELSFNRICVDNDMSTSDAVLCFANGGAGLPTIEVAAGDAALFATALEDVCLHMAHALVRDGEGATKFIEIQVAGAASNEEAKTVARSIAFSQLCKTAFFGEDANWGRIACAAGYAGAPFDPGSLCIWLDSVQVVSGGLPTAYEEAKAAAIMKQKDIKVRVVLGDGPGESLFWTSDLSHDYVSINADYRS